MRSFYTDSVGRTADLCQYVNRNTTRLTVRDPSGRITHQEEYRSWDTAMDAMKNFSDAWMNDMLYTELR